MLTSVGIRPSTTVPRKSEEPFTASIGGKTSTTSDGGKNSVKRRNSMKIRAPPRPYVYHFSLELGVSTFEMLQCAKKHIGISHSLLYIL
jgi:hypothetical protein